MKELPINPELIVLGVSQEKISKYFQMKAIREKRKQRRESLLDKACPGIFMCVGIGIIAFYLVMGSTDTDKRWMPILFLLCVPVGFYLGFIASAIIMPIIVLVYYLVFSWNIGLLIPILCRFIDSKSEFRLLEAELQGDDQRLSRYNNAVANYEEEKTEYAKLYPNIDKFNFDRVLYIESLLPSFIDTVTKKLRYIDSCNEIDWWFSLTPEDFEDEVTQWYRRKGYVASTTPFVGDGGVDIIAEKGEEKVYIQCKHYNGPVGPSVVRELFGVVKAEGATRGVLACLVEPTKGAADFAKQNGIEILTAKSLAAGQTNAHKLSKDVKYVKENRKVNYLSPYVFVGNIGIYFNVFDNNTSVNFYR